jgi:NAD(P)-dependent dehydrogenase (short-subunit alcohol dehydrogenase family)
MNEGGAIVNASSILGLIGAPNNLAYASSKHAVVGMTRVAAKELGPRKIRCNCFCPYVYPESEQWGLGLWLMIV